MVRTIFRIITISISIWLFTKCDNYEFPKSPYPRVETLGVTNISATGVKLRGSLIQLGESSVTDHGFVWGFITGVTLNVGSEGILRLGTTSSTGAFEGQVVSGLFKGKTYYVRAFVTTESYRVYGEPIEFVSNGSIPPTIEKFEPVTGTWGDTVSIHGSYFGTAPKSNLVKFGQREAKVIEASESTLMCIVPANIEALEVPITVQVTESTVQAASSFKLTVPIISGFSPASGTFLDEVTIVGSNFGANSYNQRVTIGGHRAQIVKASKTSLTVKVPTEVEHEMNEISVQFNLQTGTASSQFHILGPTLASLSKEEGRMGDMIELTGQNFNPRLLGNEVRFGENKASVVSATAHSLVVIVPKGTYSDRITTVKITIAEQTAMSGSSFKLLDAWIKKGYTPTAETSGGGFAINDIGYFVAKKYLYRYDPSTNEWTRKADFPGVFRFDQASFSAGGYGYSGLGNLGCCPGGPLTDLWRYSPGTDSWIERSSFFIESSGVLGTGLGSKGYAVDGFVTINMYEYESSSDSWNVIGDALDANFTGYPHRHEAVFVMNNRLFVFLGHQYDPGTNYLYEFDITSGSWIRRAELVEVEMNGFAINGIGYIKGFKSIHKYDLSTNQLTTNVAPLAEGYSGMIFLFAANGKAYFLGAWANDQYEFWEFDPAFL